MVERLRLFWNLILLWKSHYILNLDEFIWWKHILNEIFESFLKWNVSIVSYLKYLNMCIDLPHSYCMLVKNVILKQFNQVSCISVPCIPDTVLKVDLSRILMIRKDSTGKLPIHLIWIRYSEVFLKFKEEFAFRYTAAAVDQWKRLKIYSFL